MDGNFTANHLQQRRPEDDVKLSDGQAMMTPSGNYQAHLRIAKDYHDVSIAYRPTIGDG